MLNKMLAAIRRYGMVQPGDAIICAVSGGADSMALLWGMWLLKEKLGVTVQAAHFNHNLRGAESMRDEQFVRDFCDFHDIPLHVGRGTVVPGKKGLEAAARDARYAYLRSLNGTVATAHTADDNAETVLLHLIRGSGLRGLGGVTPKSDRLIRPMLDVTRADVEAFLAEHWVKFITDSSNATDQFLRNRLRHHVMPLLKAENPSLATGLSALAQRLRQDEALLSALAAELDPTDAAALRFAPSPLRRRALESVLQSNGFREPSASHIAQAEALVFSENPSAYAVFGDVTLRREYDRLRVCRPEQPLEEQPLPPEGTVSLPGIGLEIRCTPATEPVSGPDCFTVAPRGQMVVRCRKSGDEITLPGGTKSVKKLFIDRKIPAARRLRIPIVADDAGILGIRGIGPDEKRRSGGKLVRITFADISNEAEK